MGYDPGFHVVNAMKKVPLPYRWAWELRLSSVHGGPGDMLDKQLCIWMALFYQGLGFGLPVSICLSSQRNLEAEVALICGSGEGKEKSQDVHVHHHHHHHHHHHKTPQSSMYGFMIYY